MFTEKPFKKFPRLIAKISDFGLSKRFYDNITYMKRERKYVPWKWMAPEYLDTNSFTLSSDIWSFGIVVWEIFSMGREPYAGQTAEEIIKKLKSGYRLECPEQMDQV